MMVLSRVSQVGLWDRLAGFVMGRPIRFEVSSPTVVEMIQKLSRLETVEYSLDKIVEGERQSAYLPDFLAGGKLLLVAHGEVVAGILKGGSQKASKSHMGRMPVFDRLHSDTVRLDVRIEFRDACGSSTRVPI
jgi:hypothetical protein